VNPETFGIIGYLGLLLAAGTVVTWLLYWKLQRKVISWAACGMAIGALLCAMVNSSAHVNRIQVDPASMQAAAKALEEKKRQALLESRGGEVANIRFAEDGADEFLDKAGMEESDLEYMEKIQAGGTPDWKKEKKDRGSGTEGDDSLDALIDDEEAAGGVDAEELERQAGPEPILMEEAEVMLANRLDHLNLDLSKWLVLVGFVVIGFDYLRRVNIYDEAPLPLPLPSAVPNAVTPPPAVVEARSSAARSPGGELARFARRGDPILYLTSDVQRARDTLARVPRRSVGVRLPEVLWTDPNDEKVTDDFIFEALWFKRGSFVVDSADRAERLLERFGELWRERRSTRARTRQLVHVVWDLGRPVPDSLRQTFHDFAGPAGFSLFVIESSKSPSS
jgi:hypothetical protein